MERFTVSLDDELLTQFDDFIRRKGYSNRSEAVRDLLRDRLQEDRLTGGAAPFSVASLSYVFNHHERELARRIAKIQHAHHDLIRASLHVHLDHENCLEVALLEGPTQALRDLSDTLTAETGVLFGRLHLVPVDIAVSPAGHHHYRHGHSHPHDHDHPHDHPHDHGQAPDQAAPRRPHVHTSPKT